MPKRSRQELRETDSPDLDDVDINDLGHTPKWSRSSASASPGPSSPAIVESSSNIVASTQEMQCLLPGHAPLKFPSAMDYELHYTKEHINQCIECRANLPSAWLLVLHHDEQHDPLVAGRREREEKTYRCFLEDCEKVTATPQKRRLHLIDKHKYPRNFDFRIVDTGSAGRRSLLRDEKQTEASTRRRRVSDVGNPGWRGTAGQAVSDKKANSMTTITDEESSGTRRVLGSKKLVDETEFGQQVSPQERPKDMVEDLTGALSSLSFIPMSVRMKGKKKQ